MRKISLRRAAGAAPAGPRRGNRMKIQTTRRSGRCPKLASVGKRASVRLPRNPGAFPPLPPTRHRNIMGLFNSLFSQRQQPGMPPRPLPGMPPPPMMMERMRMRMEEEQRGAQAQELEERVAQLESDLEKTALLVESLVYLLEESGALKQGAIGARAVELGLEVVEQNPDPAEPEPAPEPKTPAPPVQPVFKQPFVAKRKWDEAADSKGGGAGKS